MQHQVKKIAFSEFSLNQTQVVGKFLICEKIGEGAFGKVYRAMNLKNKSEVGLKIEHCKNRSHTFSKEKKALKILQGIEGIPKVYSTGKMNGFDYLEMELLQKNLLQVKIETKDLEKVFEQLVEILKNIHSKGIVHRDLKPQNIMFNKEGKPYIIDFGLSLFENSVNSEIKKQGFIGNLCYASLAAHFGKNQLPKDDLQSLLYIYGHLSLKRIPWAHYPHSSRNLYTYIENLKKLTAQHWLKQCGVSFLRAYEYLQSLRQNQKTDHDYFLKELTKKKRKIIFENETKSMRITEKTKQDRANQKISLNFSTRKNTNFPEQTKKSSITQKTVLKHLVKLLNANQQDTTNQSINQRDTMFEQEFQENVDSAILIPNFSFKNPFCAE